MFNRPHIFDFEPDIINDQAAVHVRCRVCKANYCILVPYNGFRAWLNGALIQTVMPTVTPARRELLMSGTCSDCFDKLFSAEDD